MNALDEAICAHSALIGLGFDEKDIFLALDNGQAFISLIRDDKRFNIGCGPLDRVLMNSTPDEVLKAWAARVLWWNDEKTPQAARDAINAQSYVKNNSVQLITSLMNAGFPIPVAAKPADLIPKPEPIEVPSFVMPSPKGVLQ